MKLSRSWKMRRDRRGLQMSKQWQQDATGFRYFTSSMKNWSGASLLVTIWRCRRWPGAYRRKSLNGLKEPRCRHGYGGYGYGKELTKGKQVGISKSHQKDQKLDNLIQVHGEREGDIYI